MLPAALLLASPLLYLFGDGTFLAPARAQAPPPADNRSAPRLPFEVVPDFLKYPTSMNLGEVLGEVDHRSDETGMSIQSLAAFAPAATLAQSSGAESHTRIAPVPVHQQLLPLHRPDARLRYA